MMNNERNSFSNSVGFVLAAAGSAVGLGNIWRFPYLAAKDGGGLFLVIYIVLAITFGFTLLISEVAIGRKTKQSSLTAYGKINKKFGWLGGFSALVPFLILPYYCIIGGWVLKYTIAFLTGHGFDAAVDGYFTSFITAQYQPIIFDAIFLIAVAVVIYRGVNKGIEAISRILMPILFLLVVGIAIYSLTIKSPETGRSGLDGLKVYVIPSIEGLTFKKFVVVLTDAMGQLFYSISVAMGIMVTYGSYFKKESNLVKCVNQIEIFDTLIAFLAGVMIIPTVYVFMGPEGMTGGPGLMFIAIPKIFVQMGIIGQIIGAAFFVMVLFAALTSAMSVLEAVVSGFIDHYKISRRRATVIETAIALAIGIVICLGYNIFYFEVPLPNGAIAQILDIVDYISNNILMPVVAIGTCILIGWVAKPKTVIEEATINGEKFGRKHLYIVMIKFVTPVLLTILLLGSLGLI
ncbi:MAG: sodium-dependent transporter [Treponema sp.]|nr:sodium-dependent transporter [Treponema sp.]